MIVRARVAKHSDVPIIRATGAGTRGGLKQRRNELNRGLQARRRNRSGCDAERTVLPEQVVREDGIRKLRAIRMSCRTHDTRVRKDAAQEQAMWRRLEARWQERRLRDSGIRAVVGCAVRLRRIAARWRYVCVRSQGRIEEHARSTGSVIRYHRVVDEIHQHGIKERHTASSPSGYVIGEYVVGDGNRMPIARIARIALNIRPIHVKEGQSAAGTAFRGIALKQICIDDQAGADTVSEFRRTIHVDRGAVLANSSIRTHALYH